MRIQTKTLALAAILGAAMVTPSLAIPIPLPPGGIAPLTPGVVGGALLDTVTDTFANALYSGEVQSWVYNDPAWGLGLTFVYQVRLDPNVSAFVSEIHRLSTDSWVSFSTAVEQDLAAGDGGLDAEREAAPGSTLGFNIPLGFFEGEDSALFIVRSDATAWKSGVGGVINGQTSNVDILAPDRVAIPDSGASVVLLGLGLLGVEWVRRARR